MTYPDPDQISSTIRDFEHALDNQTPGMFDPLWYQLDIHGHVPGALMFDPDLSPDLYQRAFLMHRQVRQAIAASRVRYEYPFGEGRRVTDTDDSNDALVIRAADVGRNTLTAWVLNNTPAADEEHTEMVSAMGAPNIHDVTVTPDGKPVVFLSDLFAWNRVLHNGKDYEPDDVYLSDPYVLSPAQRFMYQFRCGTITTDRCDLALTEHCGGRTIYVPAFFGAVIIAVEACESCYNLTRDTICDNYRAETERAWKAVGGRR